MYTCDADWRKQVRAVFEVYGALLDPETGKPLFNTRTCVCARAVHVVVILFGGPQALGIKLMACWLQCEWPGYSLQAARLSESLSQAVATKQQYKKCST